MIFLLATLLSFSAFINPAFSEEDTGEIFPPVVDDTLIMINAEKSIGAGYVNYGSDGQSQNAAIISGVFLVDNGNFGLIASADVAGGAPQVKGDSSSSSNVFAYAEGDLKVRKRFAVDPRHVYWFGVGLDLEFRYSGSSQAQSFYKTHLPTATFGTIFRSKNGCIVHLHAKASFGIFDNETVAEKEGLNKYARPAVGLESLLQCESFRVLADAERVFSFTGPTTDRASVKITKDRKIKLQKLGDIRLGVFAKGQSSFEKSELDEKTYHSLMLGAQVVY